MKKSQMQTQLVGGLSDPWTVSGFIASVPLQAPFYIILILFSIRLVI